GSYLESLIFLSSGAISSRQKSTEKLLGVDEFLYSVGWDADGQLFFSENEGLATVTSIPQKSISVINSTPASISPDPLARAQTTRALTRLPVSRRIHVRVSPPQSSGWQANEKPCTLNCRVWVFSSQGFCSVSE